MMHHRLAVFVCFGILGGLAESAPPKSSPSESLGAVLKHKALRLFEQADKDQDHRLSRDEQAEADQRMQQIFRQLAREQTLAGPARTPPPVAEPMPLNPDWLTSAEFTQHFQAQAAKYDADLRARRLAKYVPPALPAVAWIPPSNSSGNFRSRFRDRDRWADQDRYDHRRTASWPPQFTRSSPYGGTASSQFVSGQNQGTSSHVPLRQVQQFEKFTGNQGPTHGHGVATHGHSTDRRHPHGK